MISWGTGSLQEYITFTQPILCYIKFKINGSAFNISLLPVQEIKLLLTHKSTRSMQTETCHWVGMCRCEWKYTQLYLFHCHCNFRLKSVFPVETCVLLKLLFVLQWLMCLLQWIMCSVTELVDLWWQSAAPAINERSQELLRQILRHSCSLYLSFCRNIEHRQWFSVGFLWKVTAIHIIMKYLPQGRSTVSE